MSRLTLRSSLALLSITLGIALLWWSSGGQTSTSQAQSPALSSEGEQVTFELSIEDADSGLSLTAKRRVPKGVTALDAMRGTVAMETKEYDGLGLFVTRLCGVEPVKGKFWSPSVDGEKSKLGIALIKIEKDTHLSWTTREASSE